MGGLTQDNRAFRVDVPALGPDVLLLQRFSGREAVSNPFLYTLEMISEDDAVDPGGLLRQPMVVTLVLPDGERHIHGLVRRFVQLGQNEELTFYRAEIVPWFWFLKLSQDCKIFQNKSVIEIATEVFDGLGYADYEFRCSQTYEPREYCVQYRESHFDFVSRLLEEEGAFYFFEHSDSKHVLVIADDNGAMEASPHQSSARLETEAAPGREEEVITELVAERSVHVGKITLRDYDFENPSLNLESVASGEEGEEHYDYPGRYVELSAGERYARLMLEQVEQGQALVRGGGLVRAFEAGRRFDLENHYRSDLNQPYVLLEVRQRAEAGDFRTWDTAPLQYENHFLAMPFSVPYRPPRTTPVPRIPGTQTAVVVGPSGDEIYTDEFGRVKVQFFWDRLGGHDDGSSCWVRVSYDWAGKAWGGIRIPRIGQEVIVEFLEGDPDRPLITGRVYNAEQTVPYSLPANKTQSGVKSRSSLGGSGDNFNEIRMEDKKGSEQLYIHAEKDKQVVVENDRTESVGHDETISIGNDRTEEVGNNETISIGNDRKETVGANETISIGANRTEDVGSNETISIGADRTETVGSNESITVTVNRTRKVGVNEAIAVGAAQEIGVGGNREVKVGVNHERTTGSDLSESVGSNRSTEVGENDDLKVGKKLTIEAGDEITIKTGKAQILMKKDGTIRITGKDLAIDGSGKIDVKASKNITMKGKKILQN